MSKAHKIKPKCSCELQELVLCCKEKENKKYGLTGQNLGKIDFDRKFVIRKA